MSGYHSWERRSRIKQALLLVFLFAIAAYFFGPSQLPAFQREGSAAVEERTVRRTARLFVTRIVDGDTVLLSDGRRLRLAQIDAPEVNGTECYSRRSSDALARLAPPRRAIVSIETDTVVGERDRFGRTLGYLLVADRNVNLELVRAGAASVWFYDGQRGRYAAQLLAAARQAKAAHAGLWAACPLARFDPDRAVSTG